MAFDQEYFRRYYGDYERQNPPAKLQRYLDLLRSHAPAGHLLDIGCSYGLFVGMASTAFPTIGMDVDPAVVAAAAERNPQATFVAGMLPRIPFQELAAISLLDVLEHVPEVEAALAAVRASLKPGGVALVVVPVYDGPLGWLVQLLDRDPTHLHKCSRQFWLELASRHFELLTWCGAFRKLLFGSVYLHGFTTVMRGIAPALVMLLRRPA